MRPFANFREAETALEPFFPSRLRQRQIYTTDHIRQFMDFVGNPQNIPKSIHIAGTSGKTSTAYYVAALLKQAGKKVGLMVSPHIETINERVQINLVPLPEKEFCQELAGFMQLVKKSGITLSYAEIMYGFAYWEFVRHGAEYIVVETGLGGLLDATNVISRPDKICVITDIGRDHVNTLGESLPEITQHKAGIIQLHNAVFCHRQQAIVMDVIQSACQQKEADLHIVSMEDAYTSLPHFQRRNFSLALRAVSFALERDGQPALTDIHAAAAAKTHIPARMEIFKVGGKTIILDGAHNPQKLKGLRRAMEESFAGEPVAVLAAFMQGGGRDIQEIIAELAPIANHLIVTTLPERHGTARSGRDPEDVIGVSEQAGIFSTEAVANRQAALHTLLGRPEPVLLVTGSFYLMDELRPVVVKLASS
jgi:dihydrofolate synthase / folylpolyglutamate synthase